MVIIEHEDSIEGVANLCAALSGGTAELKYGEIGPDGQLKDPKTGSGTAPGAKKSLVADVVKAVADAPKAAPCGAYDVAADNYKERNGLISLVTRSADWVGSKAHIRLRMATVGRPDFVGTPDVKGGDYHRLKLSSVQEQMCCPVCNCKACGCYFCTGVVKNGGIATNTPGPKVHPYSPA